MSAGPNRQGEHDLHAAIRDVLVLARGGAAEDARTVGSAIGPSPSAASRESAAVATRTMQAAAPNAAGNTSESEAVGGRDEDAAEVLGDALRQRDATIEQLHARIAADRTALEREVTELRGALRQQGAASKEALSAVSNRVEMLRFAAAHQGLSRDRYDSFNRTHVTDAAAESSRSATDHLKQAVDSARSSMDRSCDRAIEHLRQLTVGAREAVSQRQPSEELAEVRRLLVADHARRMELLKERVRSRMAAAVRGELEDQFASGIQHALADHIRQVVLPATVAGLRPFVDETVRDTAGRRLADESDAVRRDIAGVREQQRSVLRQMTAARSAHRTLAECRGEQSQLQGLFERLDDAERELQAADSAAAKDQLSAAGKLEADLHKARTEASELRSELRFARAGGSTYELSKKRAKATAPRSPMPRGSPPRPISVGPPAAVTDAAARLEDPALRKLHQHALTPTRSASPSADAASRLPQPSPPPMSPFGFERGGNLPQSTSPRREQSPPSIAEPRSNSAAQKRRDAAASRSAATPAALPGRSGDVLEIPMDQLKKYGLNGLLSRSPAELSRARPVVNGSTPPRRREQSPAAGSAQRRPAPRYTPAEEIASVSVRQSPSASTGGVSELRRQRSPAQRHAAAMRQKPAATPIDAIPFIAVETPAADAAAVDRVDEAADEPNAAADESATKPKPAARSASRSSTAAVAAAVARSRRGSDTMSDEWYSGSEKAALAELRQLRGQPPKR